MNLLWLVPAGLAGACLLHRGHRRLQLSRAKHPSLRGHPRLSRLLAKLVPYYGYGEDEFFRCDDAPAAVEQRRRHGFQLLQTRLRERAQRTLSVSTLLEDGLSDVAFTNRYRVPFQFRDVVGRHLRNGLVVEATAGVRIRDLDGNWAYDLGGAYGVNLFGYDFYKGCLERAFERVRGLGPVLGPYHPIVADNVARLRAISGLDEVSFHMSGTEAVMQAVRLARYHTGRSHVVRFCGSYHGWWDGVQAGVGNPRPAREVHTLRELDAKTLRVLRTRTDIACVLVNPLQALHPNSNAPSDSMLLTGDRAARYDKDGYRRWLVALREICTARGIVLIFDEVFLGFRLARGGAQEYFGVRADLVTYGKTLGGGLPVGVVCGRRDLMQRFRPSRPTDICFARGTFNSHPHVMAAMNEFLQHLDRPEVAASYDRIDAIWDGRAAALNRRLLQEDLPVRVANMTSVFTVLYTRPGRYHWMFQYYLRAEGLALGWIGTGRFIFGHDYTEADFQAVADRIVAAARAMQQDGFFFAAPWLTAAWIRHRVRRELLAACFGRRRSRLQPQGVPGGAAAVTRDASAPASPS